MPVTQLRRAAIAIVLFGSVAVACGSTSSPSTATGGSTPDVPSSTATSASTASTVSGAAGPDEPDTTTPPDSVASVVDAATLPPMTVVAALGYPRDLLDRGRVNVKISRDDSTDFVILDKRLVADHFTPAPVEERRTILPPDNRVVALQTLFGEVADCASTEPLTATLEVRFTYGDDTTPKTTSIPFTDVSVLEEILDRECTVRRVLEDNEVELRNPVVDDETMSVELAVVRRTGESRLGFDSIKGTVLFGVETLFEPGSPERILEPDETSQVIPLDIDVNRCDSHAVAETTRKFGIDLYVSVDGSESQLVEVPIDTVVDDLETMLERCKERTGQ